MADKSSADYDDGRITCDAEGLVIRRYYPWGAKRISTPGSRASSNSPSPEGTGFADGGSGAAVTSCTGGTLIRAALTKRPRW